MIRSGVPSTLERRVKILALQPGGGGRRVERRPRPPSVSTTGSAGGFQEPERDRQRLVEGRVDPR